MEQFWNGSLRSNSNVSDWFDSRLLDILEGNREFESNRIDSRHVLILVLSIAAFITNCMALGAICVIRRRLSANQTMMLSLCCADLLSSIGILATTMTQQVFAIYAVPIEQQYAAICVNKIVTAIILTGHNATLFNLLCLAVDHYCAIAKPLTYSLYMSKRRVHILLSMFWTISLLFGFSGFLIPAPVHEHCLDNDFRGKYCERVACSKYEPEHLMFCVVIICLAMMTLMYGGIMQILYYYQRQGYTTAPQRKARRHIRGLITSFIILGLFAMLWLPSCIMDAYTILRMKSGEIQEGAKIHQKLMMYLYALVILNAVCDPIVYALRMREIQEGLKTFLRFQRPTFANKMNSFGDVLRGRSSNNSFPVKYTQRQYSTNSTNTTVYSGTSLSERATFSRKGTLTSQVSELTEDTPLSGNISMAQFDLN